MKITNNDSNIYIRKEIGKRIKAIRVSKKLTQQELAEKTGISLRVITRIENGEAKTSFDNILNILRYFDMIENLEMLISDQDNNRRNKKTRYRSQRKQIDNTWKWGDEK